MKSLEWDAGVTVPSKWTSWDADSRALVLNSTPLLLWVQIPLKEKRESFNGGGSCTLLPKTEMDDFVKSLKWPFGIDMYGVFTFHTVSYSRSQQAYETDIFVSHISHTWKQQVTELGLVWCIQTLFSHGVILPLRYSVPVSEAWLPVLTLNLLFCQLRKDG